MSYPLSTKSLASQSSTSGLHGTPSISSGLATMPRPSSRCQMRFTNVRGIRPIAPVGEDGRGRGTPIGQRRRMPASASAREIEMPARHTDSSATSQRYICSFGSGEKYAASE